MDHPESDHSFYARVLAELDRRGLPHLVTGAYALAFHTGITRSTKDLDLFVHHAHVGRVIVALSEAGYRTELTHPHWLAKVFEGEAFIDIIFSSGNGVSDVDDAFFDHADEGELFGVKVRYAPVEELLWSKAFVMERERYDGADVAHLIHACAERIDWVRLVARFGAHHRVLLSHLVLFGFIYPSDKDRIPAWVIRHLVGELEHEADRVPERARPVCGGTLLSREQFLPDVRDRGLDDARIVEGAMSATQVAQWTRAIEDEPAPKRAPRAHTDACLGGARTVPERMFMLWNTPCTYREHD